MWQYENLTVSFCYLGALNGKFWQKFRCTTPGTVDFREAWATDKDNIVKNAFTFGSTFIAGVHMKGVVDLAGNLAKRINGECCQ